MTSFQSEPIIDSSPPEKRYSRKFLFILIAFCLLVSGIALALNYKTKDISLIKTQPPKERQDHQQSQPEEEFNPLPTAQAGRFNVLLLGIRGADDIKDGGLLTDTMLMVSIDKLTGRIILTNIPRDLYINMLGVRGKINQAYENGLAQNKGLALVSEIVSRISGVYIDKAVVFDFEAFKGIVDTLGGIDINLDKPFKEPTQWGYEFSLPAGNNHLTGEQALYYTRSRYSSSDFDRSRRQQEVITAIKSKALTAGYLSNPVTVSNLLANLSDHIKTNFKIWDISELLTLGSSLKQSSIKRVVISTDNVLNQTFTTGGEYILVPKAGNYKEIQALFQNLS